VTPATVEAGGVALAVDDRGGDGPPVVFVHGVAASRTAWWEVIEALGDSVRSIAYDRRAYGESGAPEPYSGTTVGEQADDLAELLEALDVGGAVVVGHGLGAMIALETLMRFPARVRACVLIDPPVLWLSPRGPEVVGDMRDAIERGARDGGPGGAVEAYLEHVAGPDALDRYGPERTEAARGDAAAFAADLVAGPSWSVTRRELRAVTAPVAVVTGRRSSPVWHEVSVALAGMLPASELIELQTGHLPMLEQPEALADAVRALV
jgi:pimeloyl-ACP methyl ester carboxylesterase